MKITPFGINVLVVPTEAPTILKSTEGNLCEYGVVKEIGDEVREIKVGDTIAFVKWGIKSLEINDEKHYFIPEDDRFVLGTIRM